MSSSSSLSSYPPFNKNERIGNDADYNTQQSIQNTNYHNYNVANYVPNKSTNDIVYFASQNPSFLMNGYHRGAGLGSNVDMDSELLITTERKNQNIPLIDLRQRMFLTVPYLGRGSANVELESTLRHGDTVVKRESDSKLNTHYIKYYDEKQQDHVNKANYIADSNAQRIGLDSKQIIS
jgi:hypothetical protein